VTAAPTVVHGLTLPSKNAKWASFWWIHGGGLCLLSYAMVALFLVVVAPVLLFSVATIDGHDSNITAWQDIFVVSCKHMGLWFIVGWDIGKESATAVCPDHHFRHHLRKGIVLVSRRTFS